MSDEQAQNEELQDAIESTSQRQAELQEARKANVIAGRMPYYQVSIRTRSELLWIMQEHGWSGDLSVGSERANLSGAVLKGLNLNRIALCGANLSGANLSRTDLTRADLRQADLSGADLSGTVLEETILNGANLHWASTDQTTRLISTKFDSNTYFDVYWGGATLTLVDWEAVPRIGDEAVVASARGRVKRIQACRDTGRVYRGLAITLYSQGLLIPASRFHIRERQIDRHMRLLQFNLLGWFASLFLDLMVGYGERPLRAFITYAATILAFMCAYWSVTNLSGSNLTKLTWDEALVLSITSFHGRGFFPGLLPLSDWIARLASAEAIVGLVIEIIIIATFTRRFAVASW